MAKAGTTGRKTEEDARKRKDQSLAFTLSQIEKQFGKGAIMQLGESNLQEVRCISTGSLSLDLALGGSGVPRSRVTEIYGPESSGKTTLTLHIIGNAQKAGGTAAFIDAEHALDPAYARKLGVDFNSLLVSQPDCGEQALEIAEMLVRSNAVDVVVVDSVAALVPKAELEGEMGDSFVGLHARLMSQALRKLTAAVAKSQCSLIFINQIREKIGVMFGSPETTTGGRALKFYSSCRLDIRRIGRIKEGDEVKGNRTKVSVVKNKIAPPFRVVEFDILFDEGISSAGDLLDLGVQHKIVDKTGSWFSFSDERLGQGRERAREFIKENPDVARRIKDLIMGKITAAREAQAAERAAKAAAREVRVAESEAKAASEQGAAPAGGGGSESQDVRSPEAVRPKETRPSGGGRRAAAS